MAKVEEFWRRCGSMVQRMEPGHHDRVLAIVSHLPHLIAFTICGTADDLADESRQEVLQFAASGFRDFTRIAASDPVMWRDIFLNNREALLEMLARFVEDAQAMSRAVRWGDAAYIEDMVERGRKIRRSLIELKQAYAQPWLREAWSTTALAPTPLPARKPPAACPTPAAPPQRPDPASVQRIAQAAHRLLVSAEAPRQFDIGHAATQHRLMQCQLGRDQRGNRHDRTPSAW